MKKYIFISIILIAIIFDACNKYETTFTVTFNTNGGNEIEPIKIKKGENLASLGVKDPIMEEHTFKHWNLFNNAFNAKTPILEDITLEAVWKSLNWDVRYIYERRGVEIIKYIGDNTDTIVVPSTIEGFKLLKIYTFLSMSKTSTNIDTVKRNSLRYLDCSKAIYLESIAGFYKCKNLTEVSFPNSLKKVGDSAFENTNLKKIDLSNTQVTHIERFAFNLCSNLSSITFSNTLEYIGEYAFQQGTHKLKHLTFPKSLKVIDEKAFTTCYGLETIKVTRAVKGDLTKLVGFEPFHVCDNITTKYYPKGSKYKEDEVELGWVSEDTGEPVAGTWVEY